MDILDILIFAASQAESELDEEYYAEVGNKIMMGEDLDADDRAVIEDAIGLI